MLAKFPVPSLFLVGALVLASCGGSEGSSSTSNGGSGAGGGAGGSTATAGSGGANGGSGGVTGTGGMTSSGGTGGTTMTNPGCSGLGDACTDCLVDKCNMTYCTCYADPACGALVQCSQGCNGDANCNQNCFTQNQNGISEAGLLSDCAAANCAACPGTAALPTCEKCAFSKCSADINKCLANPDCAALVACAQDCAPNDNICIGGCAFQYPDGQADAQALQSCVSNQCSGECG